MKNLIVLDCEVYPNYTLFAFKNIENQKVVTIEIKGENSTLTKEHQIKLNTIMVKRTTFGFNSSNYDMPVILYALKFKTCLEIYNLSKHIINNNSPGWLTLNKFNLIQKNSMHHFDIQEPSPGVRVSLKLYGGRMNSKRLQDLPIEPESTLSDEEMENIKLYCINDLNTTIDLYCKIKERIQLRIDMSKDYGKEILSKSDAQIAEIVIKKELKKKHPNKYFKKPVVPDDITFKYIPPEYIKFETPQLKNLLQYIENHNFELDTKGSIKLPSELKKTKIKIGDTQYQLGIGGIHSKEKKQVVIPNDNQLLIDKDVTSYYPSIILNLELYPKHLGLSFLDVYRKIVNDRIEAKKMGNKVVNESLKIVINGSFGKLGSKYSVLYSPDLMMTVTLTGQLSLLMLIEKLESNGIKVVSANTDGVVSLVPKNLYHLYDTLCVDWELNTNFALEDTNYTALYSRDVNNYLAVSGKKSKGKGIFTIDAISKNPQSPICIIAVKEFLINKIPIDRTIRDCKDVTKFLNIRSVTGGAVYREKYLGRVVRWYYVTDGDTIYYKKNGNKVPKSDGSMPIMEIGTFPENIDYSRYINDALEILNTIGL